MNTSDNGNGNGNGNGSIPLLGARTVLVGKRASATYDAHAPTYDDDGRLRLRPDGATAIPHGGSKRHAARFIGKPASGGRSVFSHPAIDDNGIARIVDCPARTDRQTRRYLRATAHNTRKLDGTLHEVTRDIKLDLILPYVRRRNPQSVGRFFVPCLIAVMGAWVKDPDTVVVGDALCNSASMRHAIHMLQADLACRDYTRLVRSR